MGKVSIFWRGLKKILMSATALLLMLPVQAVMAVEPAHILAPEPTTYWQASSDLLVSAYQRDLTGEDIQLVEVYNDGKSPIDTRSWTIEGTFRDGAEVRTVAMDISLRGEGRLLEPGKHAIIDAADIVAGASYEMDAWSASKPTGKLVALTTKKIGYSTQEYVLKETSTKSAGVVVTRYDELWRRSVTTTGYSSSTTAFVAGSGTIYDAGLYEIPGAPGVRIVEIYPYASSCTPFDESVLCRDYVKLHNPFGHDVELTDYVLRTDSSSADRTSANTVSLDSIVIPAHGYYPVSQTDDGSALSLTNSGGYVWLEDAWGLVKYTDTLAGYESASSSKQGYVWAQEDSGTWAWSPTPQPVGQNLLTVDPAVVNESVDCPVGKYRNPETNRCRTIEEAVNALATCPEGQSRNLATNRCRSNETQKSSGLTPCKEGQERNLATNRCRSIASAIAELMPCDEGQERNPATNRCRKIQNLDMPLAGFPVEPVKPSGESMIMWWVLAGVVTLLAGYGAWEWRSEIGLAARKLAVVTRLKK